MISKQEIKELILTAVKASLDAGKAILEVYNTEFDVDYKRDNSPLTQADQKSHDTIVSYLKSTPYPILSEEGRSLPWNQRKEWATLWIVDPLDGTKEFVNRNGEFTVNIALVEKGTPIGGVIYVPVTQTLYFAGAGIHAWRVTTDSTLEIDSFEILINQSESLPVTRSDRPFTVVGSRSHMSEETERYIEKYRRKHDTVDVVSRGSSLKICMVAEGAADIYPRFAPTMEWDTAAGHAIAVESGAVITQSDEKTVLQYNKEDLLNPWFIVKREE